ncbi:cobalamin biosynthesis protein CbiX [Oscillatoriales cyanobacterium USR001]|nr:cobalamin biosynthesis protein CbiX [Oscillatoriales cyanobacterium USR001]
MLSSYLLVTHGSRDPRSQLALEKLAKLLSDRLANLSNYAAFSPIVGTATLEFGATSLHGQICEFGKYSLSLGLKEMQVLPLFLLPGVHVIEDIPAEVAIAQQIIGEKLTINLRSHLGSQTVNLTNWLANQMKSATIETWILLSHGSRRTGGNLPVEEIAAKVNAIAAYWSVSPSLETQITNLVRGGHQKIGIMPYFLFNGGITDAIGQTIKELKPQFPHTELHLANPLGTSLELVDLIRDLIEQ